jgi:hypothetical protein
MIPVTPRTSDHFIQWCKLYQEGGTVPQPAHIRFSIGFYQISQGMQWHINSPVRWQSFCAAAMHFTMCAYAHDLDMSGCFPTTLEDFPEEFEGWETLIQVLGKAQQQIIYSPTISKGSTRTNRFSYAALHVYLYKAIEQCFALTPQGHRESRCFDEMKILCGDLPEKKPC